MNTLDINIVKFAIRKQGDSFWNYKEEGWEDNSNLFDEILKRLNKEGLDLVLVKK